VTEPTAGAVIYAADAARLSVFYARLTGFAIVQASDEYVLLRAPAFELVILTTAESRAAGNGSLTPRTQAPIKPVFYVPDLAAARIVARELGGAVKSVDAEWRFHDSIVCDGHDPEGNIFQLRQRI
jgi:predicted enzyme related to lactoylglutathione lyase